MKFCFRDVVCLTRISCPQIKEDVGKLEDIYRRGTRNFKILRTIKIKN